MPAEERRNSVETISRMRGQWKQNRLLAAAACLLLFVVLFSATSYLALESNHDCIGEDCPVCACLEQCGQVIRLMGTGLLADAVILFAALPIRQDFTGFFSVFLLRTPVLQRVRLNC